MKAYAYLRVSGKSQLDGDGFPRQKEAISRYAAANGVQIVNYFEEQGVSGATEWENRPAWSAMVASLNGVRTIIVEKLDRLARDLFVQEFILRDLAKREVKLISVAEPDLDSDPTRVMFRQILGSISQYEKANIVNKLRAARDRIKATGARCEGCRPYGHYPGEAEVLAEMREMAQSQTPAAIARALGSRGSRSGKPWHPFVVARILRSRIVPDRSLT